MEKKPRIATLSYAEEFRRMKVGDVTQFPVDKYEPSSVRSTPGSSLLRERMNGMQWRTKVNYKDRCVDVTRIS